MLKIFVHNADGFHIFTEAFYPGHQGTDATDDQFDLHACVVCLVELIDDLIVDQAVQLQERV